MGQRTIDTVLKLSGESEYKSALKSCSSDLKLLKSDLDATTSEFRNNANSMEALSAKGEVLSQMYSKQQEKVSILAGALEKANSVRDSEEQQVADLKDQYDKAKSALAAYGDEVDKNSQEYQEAAKNAEKLRDEVIKHQAKLDSAKTSVERYSTQLNRAHIDLDKLSDKVDENNRLMAEAEVSADGCATSIDRYGKQVKEAAKALDDAADEARDFDKALGDVDSEGLSFGDVLGADMIADAVGTIIESIGEVAEESKEYRQIMASLKESSEDAGYSAGETAEMYGKLQGVLDDTQAAATTTANLQALGIEQEKLKSLTDGVIGSWAKYGDSIPIDGLAEAVNHSAQLGEVQGTLADVLERGGVSVDEFNAQLAACTSTTERADLIAQMFAEQGLTQMGKAWQQNNASLIESNQASEKMMEQFARLGETVEPIITGLTEAASRMLGVINDGLEDLTEKTAAQDLKASMDAYVETMNKAAVATTTTSEEVESSSYIAQQYVKRLDELEASGLDTAESQREYASTVELLNELIPDLNLSIDKTTGLLDQDTDMIMDNIDAWKKRTTAQALQKQLTTQIEAQADAQAALYQAEAKQIELSAKEEDILRQLEDARARAAEETENSAGAMGLLTDAMALGLQSSGDLSGSYEELANKSLGITDEVAALETELNEVRSAQSDLDEEVEKATGILANSEDQIKTATDAYEQFADQAADAAGTVSDGSADMADSVDAATQKMVDAYNAAKAAATESIDRQIGLFDDLSGKSELSTEDMIKNLQSQREAFENYADNLTLAMERGIDIGLVQKLSDGSVESMQILAELVTATDEQIAALNSEFQGVSEAKDYAAEGMAGIADVFLEKLVEMGALTKQEAYEMGQALVDGLAEGVEDRKPVYVEAVEDTANAGAKKYKEVNLIASPSRRYKQLAKYDVDGLIVQYQEDRTRVEKASAEIADSGYLAMVRSRQSAMSSFGSSVASVQAPQDNRLYSLLLQLLAAVREGKVIALDKNALVGATASVYDAKFGQMKILADRGAT